MTMCSEKTKFHSATIARTRIVKKRLPRNRVSQNEKAPPTTIALLSLLFCAPVAFGQSATSGKPVEPEQAAAQQVEIKAAQAVVEASHDFAAGKLIVSRKQIAESGLQNVTELLKREPAITVAKDGRIGLMGLPGYTQILLNGQNASGKNPLELDLAEVERIEIIKTSTAETGPFGIAGTINVISRKVERFRSQQASIGLVDIAGDYGGNGAWAFNQFNPLDPLQWRLGLTVNRKRSESPSIFQQNEFNARYQLLQHYRGSTDNLSEMSLASLSSAWMYRLDSENTMSLSPSLGYFGSNTHTIEQREYSDLVGWKAQSQFATEMHGMDWPFNWKHQLDDDSSLEIDLKASRNFLDARSTHTNRQAFMPDLLRTMLSEDRSDSYRAAWKYLRNFSTDHEFSAGGSWSDKMSDTKMRYWLNGLPDASLAMFGDRSQLRSTAVRWYLQDEWRITKDLAINTGLSTEDQRIAMDEGPIKSVAHYQVWSPSLHLSRKFAGDNKRQLRFSVAKSFQEPDVSKLLQRPSINALAPCQALGKCSPNSPDTADSAGNPQLQAERAWSLNASYDHGISGNSQIGVEVYARKFEQKFGRELRLEQVAWSDVPRFVDRPLNLGDARIVGINVDGKLAMRDFWTAGPKLEIKGSVGRAHSVIDNLPAPYNHFEGQTAWRGKLGLSYHASDIPLRLNFDASWLPSDWIRNSVLQKSYESRFTSYSAGGIWTFNKSASFSLNLYNLFSADKLGVRDYQLGEGFLRRASQRPVYTQVVGRLEMKF